MNIDRTIQRDVLDELEWEPELEASSIGVIVEEGVVRLTGEVPTFADRLTAEKAARRVGGVRAVADDLEVRLREAHLRSDPAIVKAAVQALRWNTPVPDDRITLLVDDGWITLDGTVDWQYQRLAAQNAVSRLVGVTGVSNRMQLEERPPSEDIREQIEAAIARTADLDASDLELRVYGGSAFLSGHVASWAQREAAERAVWSAPGVTSVENALVVGTPVTVF